VGFNAFLYVVCIYINRVRRAPSLNERHPTRLVAREALHFLFSIL
jgi:hypothetical protein